MMVGQAAHHASENAWRAITTARRFPDHEVHVTHLQGCLRQLHYRANGVPVTDPPGTPEMMIAAHLGTAIDRLYVPQFATEWAQQPGIDRTEPHFPLAWQTPDITVIGEADTVAFSGKHHAEMWDLKTVNATKFDAVADGYVPPEHVWQILTYARLLELQTGRTVTHCHLHYLCRSDPQAYSDHRKTRRYVTLTQEYTPTDREATDTLLDTVSRAATSTTAAPYWFGAERGKISSRYSPCHTCPWQTRCLGKPVQCEDANAVVRAEVAQALAEAVHHTASASRNALSAVREFVTLTDESKRLNKVKGTLTELVEALGLEDGVYDTGSGRIEIYAAGGGQIPDQKAMAETLDSLGIPVPKKPRASSLRARVVNK